MAAERKSRCSWKISRATCKPEEVAGTRAIEHNAAFASVTVLTGPANTFHAPEPLDLVFTSQNYHDLHDEFMRPTEAAVFNKAVFEALKPGGAYVIIDHVARPRRRPRPAGACRATSEFSCSQSRASRARHDAGRLAIEAGEL
jgi:predicted methyltransferase